MDYGSAGGDHPGMQRRLPSATVTFLFTDVEGSTRLLQELGAEAYADALRTNDRTAVRLRIDRFDARGDPYRFGGGPGAGSSRAHG